MWWAPTLLMVPFRKHREVPWDGTQNMPMLRLADPRHKDSYNILF